MTDIAFCGLATLAIVFLLKYTDGPFDVFFHLRRIAKLEIPILDEADNIDGYHEDDDPEGFFALWFKCFWCMSTWISFFIAIAYILLMMKPIILFPFLWFASLGVSGILLELVRIWRR